MLNYGGVSAMLPVPVFAKILFAKSNFAIGSRNTTLYILSIVVGSVLLLVSVSTLSLTLNLIRVVRRRNSSYCDGVKMNGGRERERGKDRE